jgi:hypothetical protein
MRESIEYYQNRAPFSRMAGVGELGTPTRYAVPRTEEDPVAKAGTLLSDTT